MWWKLRYPKSENDVNAGDDEMTEEEAGHRRSGREDGVCNASPSTGLMSETRCRPWRVTRSPRHSTLPNADPARPRGAVGATGYSALLRRRGPGSTTCGADATHPKTRPGDIARMLQRGWQRLVCVDPGLRQARGRRGQGHRRRCRMPAWCWRAISSSCPRRQSLSRRSCTAGSCRTPAPSTCLTRIVGLRKATELLMLGEPVDAARCERLGLVNRVVTRTG